MGTIRFPEITVKLLGKSGNAFAILGSVTQAMKKAGVSKGYIDEFTEAATSQGYDELLQTCMEWVTVE